MGNIVFDSKGVSQEV